MFISEKGKILPTAGVCVCVCELHEIFIFSFILLNIL